MEKAYLIFLLLWVPAFGATYIVDDDGPADFNSIQEAINYSWHGDTVIVQIGTYYENVYFYEKAVTLTSTNPNDPNIVAQTIIDGNQADSVITFAWNEDSNSVIDGFTITNGDALYGGGIVCWGDVNPLIINCKIIDNHAFKGGGIAGGGGSTASIVKCEIVNNVSDNDGGGMWGCDGNITDCNISNNNTGHHGGGLSNCHGEINNCIISYNWSNNNHSGGGLADCDGKIINCKIIGNSSTCYGGGLASCGAEINKCLIEDNWAEDGGGGLYLCTGLITDCIISNNVSPMSGGGLRECQGEILNCIIKNNEGRTGGGLVSCNNRIMNSEIIANKSYIDGGGLFLCNDIQNCKISQNYALGNGGGTGNCGGVIKNCIISGNIAIGNGGGIDCSNNTRVPNIYCCSIIGNRAILGGGIYFGEDSPDNVQVVNNIICNNENFGIYWKYTTPKDLSHNNLWGNFGSNYGGWSIPGIGDINVDPCFVTVGYWTDPYNTPSDINDDIWIEGDYHLQSEVNRWDPNQSDWVHDVNTSLCIDAGNPNSDWTAELWPHGKTINIGAYGGTQQASMSLSDVGNPADLNNDGIVDFSDAETFTEKWLFNETLLAEDIDRDKHVDLKDFSILAQNWLWHE